MAWRIDHRRNHSPRPPYVGSQRRVAEANPFTHQDGRAARRPSVRSWDGGCPHGLPAVPPSPRRGGWHCVLGQPGLLCQEHVRIRAQHPPLQCPPPSGIDRLDGERELLRPTLLLRLTAAIPRRHRPPQGAAAKAGIKQCRLRCGINSTKDTMGRHRHARWAWIAGLPHSGGIGPPGHSSAVVGIVARGEIGPSCPHRCIAHPSVVIHSVPSGVSPEEPSAFLDTAADSRVRMPQSAPRRLRSQEMI